MDHLQPYAPRPVLALPAAEVNGWKLKRYGVLAKDRVFDSAIAASALDAAIKQLPIAGKLEAPAGNHGIGFQIIHFADVAVVSPVFYWMWGSVLANVDQLRAQWASPTVFEPGVKEVIGCVWELQILCFEAQLWTNTMLGEFDAADRQTSVYLETSLPAAKTHS